MRRRLATLADGVQLRREVGIWSCHSPQAASQATPTPTAVIAMSVRAMEVSMAITGQSDGSHSMRARAKRAQVEQELKHREQQYRAKRPVEQDHDGLRELRREHGSGRQTAPEVVLRRE